MIRPFLRFPSSNRLIHLMPSIRNNSTNTGYTPTEYNNEKRRHENPLDGGSPEPGTVEAKESPVMEGRDGFNN